MEEKQYNLQMLKTLGMFFLAFFSLSVYAANSVQTQIQTIIDGAYADNWFQGSVLVIKGGNTVYSGAVGKASWELGVDNQPDSVFSVGSVSKQFTAAMIMKLVSKGKIDLDEPLSTYIPYYKQSCPELASTTIRNALNMRTNIEDYSNYWDFMSFNRVQMNPVEFATTYACVPLNMPPQPGFSYSDTNYFLLGAVIEAVSGMDYASYFNQTIVEPLSLSNTGYFNQDGIVEGHVGAYISSTEGFSMAPIVSYSVAYAAGALYSSPQDLLAWLKGLLSNQLFSSKYTKQMINGDYAKGKANATTGFIEMIYPDSLYGFGLVIQDKTVESQSLQLVGHGGIINGYVSQIWAINTGTEKKPVWDSYVAVLGNVQNDCFASTWIADDIISVIYGGQPTGIPPNLSGYCKAPKPTLFAPLPRF